jgi:hypothetical protein
LIDQLEATRALVKGTEINLEELPNRAVQSLIVKVYLIQLFVIIFNHRTFSSFC